MHTHNLNLLRSKYQNGDTAGIISLLTHTCNSVALSIFLHPQLTVGHQSSKSATPAVEIPANPSQIQIPSSGMLTEGLP